MSVAQPARSPAVLGVDIGGTFTDFVLVRNGELRIHKVPSTSADPSEAFARGLEELGVPADARLVHGSTVATNAVLERRGARTAFLTTRGFRDLLELGRQTRLRLYALTPTKPEPLVPRERCFEVTERVDRHGAVLAPLDEEELRRTLDAIRATGAESLAVTFLFSFANPAHERQVGELATARGLSVSLSCEILPEYREYERASTTVANAYVAPLMDRYLRRLEERLRRDGRSLVRFRVMQSNGGLLSAEAARREAVRTILSGPAGGAIGAWRLAALAGFERVLSFDMGGTSTDVSLAEGEPTTSSEGEIGGLPIRVPMLDIHTIGAGGGSIVRLDSGGALRVGPESAGADPGPAAYGRGDAPTVTDAHLVLGRLDPAAFLGGRMPLYPERSRKALEPIAARLALSPEELAEGVIRIANAQMARALRRVSLERGHDPRNFCLVAFGGGGPLHACELAAELGIPTVLVPRYPGTLSALGMLLADVRKDYSRAVMRPLPEGAACLEPLIREMERQAREDLRGEGVPEDAIRLARRLDVRYRGQSYELRVAAPDPELPPGEAADRIAEAFHREHRRRFGYAAETAPCEIVNARLEAIGAGDAPPLAHRPPGAIRRAPPEGCRPVRAGGVPVEAALFRRDRLIPGEELTGPALVLQDDSTVWLPPGWRASVDGWYNLVCRRP